VAFRLGWTQHIKIIFFIPVALGFDPVLFLYVIKLRFYQFWIHTEYIRKLPAPIEYILSPSHHRVHHSSNDKYLDKNFGSTFIIWDRMFGFSIRGRETSVRHYNPINSYPITLNFHIWKDIISDVMKSRSLKEAYALMFTNPLN
jgi:sterol desaturase/sphingolipid hydroxylase (fatty acid hydroxylase superfamily)